MNYSGAAAERKWAAGKSDIKILYETDDWETAKQILSNYDIRYVFIGSMERGLYQVRESKFANHMKEEFSNQDTVIYSWTEVSINGK